MIPIPPLAGPRALESLGPGDTPFFKELLVVEAFEEGLKRGTASVRVRGQMVDISVYNRAKALLEQKQAIDELEQRKTRVVGRLG